MLKVPFSGGPSTGKTTLIEALHQEFPHAHIVPEPAEAIITRELAKQAQDPAYVPVAPWVDYAIFGPAVANESVILEQDIPPQAGLVFQDRSLIDTVAYYRLNGLHGFESDLKKRINAAKYAFAIFCEPVGEYVATNVRRETPEEARRTHHYLAEAYHESGIPVLHLPAVNIEERVAIVRDVVRGYAI